MISAAEAQEVGWPLPAALVARTESMRSCVATFRNAAMRGRVCTGTKRTSEGDDYNHPMLALRYLYALALVVWLGGMLVLGAIAAPTTFEVLQASAGVQGRELAGAVFGSMLARFHYLAYGAGAVLLLTLGVMRVLGPRPIHSGVRAAIVALMLGVALYSGFVVLKQIDAVQVDAGGLPSRLPAGDARRVQFDALHVLSTRLMMFNIAGALVLLYWEARE
jgi:uncharacterized membrane protein